MWLPAGLVVTIIREDLLGNARPTTPVMMNYKVQADADSLYNTPPCWCIYICKLVLEWIKALGGLEAMEKRNREKAKLLYDFLDNSKLFHGHRGAGGPLPDECALCHRQRRSGRQIC